MSAKPLPDRRSSATFDRRDGLDYVRYMYGVEVEIGQRVTCDGKLGVVVFDGRFATHYVHVLFDEGYTAPCHPTWRMDYSPDVPKREEAGDAR